MAGIGTAPAPPVEHPPGPPRRRLGGRVSTGHVVLVVAGLVAGLANYAVLRGADDTVQVLVASRDLAAGEIVEAGLFRPVRAGLDGDLLDRVLRPGDLEAHAGSVIAAAIPAGAPLRPSDLRSPAGPGGTRRMSLAVDLSHAAGGAIRAGDRVDVIAVREGRAVYVVGGAEVVAVDRGGQGALAGLDRFAISIAVDAEAALCLAEAMETGSIEVVLSTGAAPVEATGCPRDGTPP